MKQVWLLSPFDGQGVHIPVQWLNWNWHSGSLCSYLLCHDASLIIHCVIFYPYSSIKEVLFNSTQKRREVRKCTLVHTSHKWGVRAGTRLSDSSLQDQLPALSCLCSSLFHPCSWSHKSFWGHFRKCCALGQFCGFIISLICYSKMSLPFLNQPHDFQTFYIGHRCLTCVCLLFCATTPTLVREL